MSKRAQCDEAVERFYAYSEEVTGRDVDIAALGKWELLYNGHLLVARWGVSDGVPKAPKTVRAGLQSFDGHDYAHFTARLGDLRAWAGPLPEKSVQPDVVLCEACGRAQEMDVGAWEGIRDGVLCGMPIDRKLVAMALQITPSDDSEGVRVEIPQSVEGTPFRFFGEGDAWWAAIMGLRVANDDAPSLALSEASP